MRKRNEPAQLFLDSWTHDYLFIEMEGESTMFDL